MSSKEEADDLTSRRWQLLPGAIIGVGLATLLVGIWLAFGGVGSPTPLAGRGEWLAGPWRSWPSLSSSSSSHFSSSWAPFPPWSLVFILVFFVFFFALPWFSWGLSAARAGTPDNGVRHGEPCGRSQEMLRLRYAEGGVTRTRRFEQMMRDLDGTR